MLDGKLSTLRRKRNVNSVIRYFLTLFLLFRLLLISGESFSQSHAELDRLIFDPVLLDPETLQVIPPFDVDSSESDNSSFIVPAQTAAPVSVNRADISMNIKQYEEQLDSIEGDAGPFATDLYETLLDLGNQYQQLGDHESAIETFERAEYVSRINHGLFHPEQVASIEGLIKSYMAMGDFSSANAKQRYLIYLSEQYYGQNNLNALPSIISLAEQNKAFYEQILSMPVQPSIAFRTSVIGQDPAPRQPTQRQMAFGSLFQAQQNYVRAISTLMDNRLFFDPILLDLEYNYIETLFLQAYRSAIIAEPDYYLSENYARTGTRIRSNTRRNTVSYLRGLYAFERMLIYIRNNPKADPLLLVNTLMDYGDWNLLFGRTRSAVEKYTEAKTEAARRAIPGEQIDNIVRPQLHAHLPLITAKPNSREKFGIAADERLNYDGYIDIAYTISHYGRVGKIKILDKSEGVTRKVERRLKRFLRNSPFRPRLQEDGSVKAERVTVRYYFGFADKLKGATQDTSS